MIFDSAISALKNIKKCIVENVRYAVNQSGNVFANKKKLLLRKE
jgi:hypothetical protein